MRILFAAATLVAVPAAAQSVKTADYEFRYSYPAAARAVPALRAWFERDRRAARARTAAESAADRREMRRGGFPYRPHDDTTEWKVVTETPRFLSLSGSHYTYTGGAHGGTNTLTLLWDKASRRRLAPRDVFASTVAIQHALAPGFCRGLDVERARRRGAPVQRGADPFSACPKLSETVLLLGSTDRRRIDRIGVIADQYVAGPYAEGSYEVTLQVTRATLAAVKPGYRAAFAVR